MSQEQQDEVQSGKNWSRVAELFAKIINEDDPQSTTSISNANILAALKTTLPLSEATCVIDMGCGAGPLMASILKQGSKDLPEHARLVAADVSQSFLDMVEKRKQEQLQAGHQIWQRLEVQRWDCRDLKDFLPDNAVSHLLANFCYFTIGDDVKALTEALRVLQPGGAFLETSLGFTTWGHMPSFVNKVRPDIPVHRIPERWQSAPAVEKLLSSVGFQDVKATEYEVSVAFEKHEEAVEFVLEVFPFMKPVMAQLSESEAVEVKQLMLNYVKENYPEEPYRMQGVGVLGIARK